MSQFDNIFKLTKKLSKALLKNKGLKDLEGSDLFSEASKKDIAKQLSDEKIKENLALLKRIDKEAGWKQIEHKISHINDVKPNNRLKIKPYFKLAVAAILLISLAYITFKKPNNIQPLEVEQVHIPSGSDKAILTLEDGMDIILEKGKAYKNKNVDSNGEHLEYSKTNSSSKTVFNYLTIPRGGQYQITLADGTHVWLNADTKLKYPVNFVEGEPRVVELVYGEAYFEVSASSKHQGANFKVVSKLQEVEVLGTAFNIKAYNDEPYIFTSLVEGLVDLVVDEKKEGLQPGEQSTLHIDSKAITIGKVHVDHEIAWVRGYFNFKDKPLKDIMKVLSRWYDVDISFASDALEAVRFSGLLNRKHSLNTLLNGIKNTKSIHAYEINDKTVTIK